MLALLACILPVARDKKALERVMLPTQALVKLVLPEPLEATLASLILSGILYSARIGRKYTSIWAEKGRAAYVLNALDRQEDER